MRAGHLVDKYELVQHLATGGMANVYLARVSGLGGFQRHVVLKTLPADRITDDAYVTMFLDEARLIATLHHPHVAQVYDVGCTRDGTYFLAMEYLHGETAQAVLEVAEARSYKLPLDIGLTISTAAASALHHAHERRNPDGIPLGIVHRDVSPSNLIVSYDGSVKLIDFGIAKAQLRATQTRSGFIKGKAGYMAPEQARGYPVDRRSDVFALGVLVYELTTQQRAFHAESQFEMIERVVHGDATPPSEHVPGYPRVLEQIVMTALELDPDDRFQTADEMRRELELIGLAEGCVLGPACVTRVMQDLYGVRVEPWLAMPGKQRSFARGTDEHRTPVEEPPTSPYERAESDPGFLGASPIFGDEPADLSIELAHYDATRPPRSTRPTAPSRPAVLPVAAMGPAGEVHVTWEPPATPADMPAPVVIMPRTRSESGSRRLPSVPPVVSVPPSDSARTRSSDSGRMAPMPLADSGRAATAPAIPDSGRTVAMPLPDSGRIQTVTAMPLADSGRLATVTALPLADVDHTPAASDSDRMPASEAPTVDVLLSARSMAMGSIPPPTGELPSPTPEKPSTLRTTARLGTVQPSTRGTGPTATIPPPPRTITGPISTRLPSVPPPIPAAARTISSTLRTPSTPPPVPPARTTTGPVVVPSGLARLPSVPPPIPAIARTTSSTNVPPVRVDDDLDAGWDDVPALPRTMSQTIAPSVVAAALETPVEAPVVARTATPRASRSSDVDIARSLMPTDSAPALGAFDAPVGMEMRHAQAPARAASEVLAASLAEPAPAQLPLTRPTLSSFDAPLVPPRAPTPARIGTPVPARAGSELPPGIARTRTDSRPTSEPNTPPPIAIPRTQTPTVRPTLSSFEEPLGITIPRPRFAPKLVSRATPAWGLAVGGLVLLVAAAVLISWPRGESSGATIASSTTSGDATKVSATGSGASNQVVTTKPGETHAASTGAPAGTSGDSATPGTGSSATDSTTTGSNSTAPSTGSGAMSSGPTGTTPTGTGSPGTGSSSTDSAGTGSGSAGTSPTGTGTAPDSDTVILDVTTDPVGATVVLDGVRLGTAPFHAPVKRKAGTAWVKVRMHGRLPIKKAVTLDNDVSWTVHLPVLPQQPAM